MGGATTEIAHHGADHRSGLTREKNSGRPVSDKCGEDCRTLCRIGTQNSPAKLLNCCPRTMPRRNDWPNILPLK